MKRQLMTPVELEFQASEGETELKKWFDALYDDEERLRRDLAAYCRMPGRGDAERLLGALPQTQRLLCEVWFKVQEAGVPS